MSEFKFRLARPEDAAIYAEWVAQNPDIDHTDLMAGTMSQNPTVLTFVVEKDGQPIAFAPLYLQLMLPHLGLDPTADGKDKMRALEMMINGVSAVAVQFGIREIMTMSQEEYPIAQWAMKHNFELEPRQALKLDLNKVMAAEV